MKYILIIIGLIISIDASAQCSGPIRVLGSEVFTVINRDWCPGGTIIKQEWQETRNRKYRPWKKIEHSYDNWVPRDAITKKNIRYFVSCSDCTYRSYAKHVRPVENCSDVINYEYQDYFGTFIYSLFYPAECDPNINSGGDISWYQADNPTGNPPGNGWSKISWPLWDEFDTSNMINPKGPLSVVARCADCEEGKIIHLNDHRN